MWYVIQVTSGKEDKMLPQIAKVLESFEDIELFIPRYVCMRKYRGEWHKNHAVLFPGYVFLDTDFQDVKDIQKVLHIFIGLVKPVCIGGGFYPIKETEQQFLENVMDSMHEIGFSVGNIVDGELIVDEGPLMNLTQYVVRIDRHKRLAEVVFKLWGEDRSVRVGLEVKEKIVTNEYRRQAVS